MNKKILVAVGIVSLVALLTASTTINGDRIVASALTVQGVFTAANGAILGTPTSGDATNLTNIPVANAKSGSVLPAANAPVGSWVRIGENVLGGTAATVTFSSIPATYRNLMLTLVARTDVSANSQDCYLQFNGDGAGNYARQFIEAHAGNNLDGGSNTATAKVGVIAVTAANSLANAPGMASVVIPNYSGTTFFKIGVNYSGFYVDGATTAAQRIQPTGIVWSNTAAINAIEVGLTGAGNFIAGSTFDLYAQ